jgi:hypothetical protein
MIGQCRITADTALRLGRYFRNTPTFWMNLQTRFDLEVAEDEIAASLGMPDAAAWSGRSDLFSNRLDRQKPSLAELQYAVLEFHDLVGTYVNLCTTAVFGRLPQDSSAAMNPRAKTELAAFRQISFGFGTVTQRDQPIASVSEAAAVFLCASEAFALREQLLSVHARVAREQFGPFRKPPVKHMLTCKRHQ